MSYTIRVFEDCDVCCFTEVRFCCSLRFWRKSGTKLKFDEAIWEMIMHVVSRFFWYTCLRLQNLFNHLVLTKILLWMKTKYFWRILRYFFHSFQNCEKGFHTCSDRANLLATHSSCDLWILSTGLQVFKSNSFLNQSSKETIKDRME